MFWSSKKLGIDDARDQEGHEGKPLLECGGDSKHGGGRFKQQHASFFSPLANWTSRSDGFGHCNLSLSSPSVL